MGHAALVRHDTTDTIVESPPVCGAADATEIARLCGALGQVSGEANPRTARRFAAGRKKIAQKLMEEAGQAALEAVRHHPRALVRESADLVYQPIVLRHECGTIPEPVWAEIQKSFCTSTITSASRSPGERGLEPRVIFPSPLPDPPNNRYRHRTLLAARHRDRN
ncbi:MAG TPA: phosphoribosyl-ATP diphosphatase [Stellaceae bacterium]|jgi:phosphoribosyl-ATP pyrophosphohydrolase